MGDRRRKPIADRFWAKVTTSQNPKLCWGWSACLSYGYGKFWWDEEVGLISAQRASWMIHKGKIPKGKWVLHSCDNRQCTNIDHLFLGTAQSNTDDMMSKGRHAGARSGVRGEDHGRAKLSAVDIPKIRKLGSKKKHAVIAKMFGVSRPTISAIVRGDQWKTVHG